MDEREQAQEEARIEMERASRLAKRPRVVIEGKDVTEAVVSVLDALIGSLDWGSGFLDETEVKAVVELAQALNFKFGEQSAYITEDDTQGRALEEA